VSQALARRGGALLMLVCLGAGAGCGSTTTTSAEPFPQFEGVWAIDDDTSVLHCPQEVGLENLPFSIWGGTITMAAGVLTDLVETNGTCSLGYDADVAKNMASLANPDPYTGMAPTCTLSLGSDGSNIVFTPTTATSPWVFNLLAPVKDKAPTAQLVGVAAATVTLADANGNLATLTPCMFVAQVNLHQYAKP
jgi:hypothetical protein